MSSLRNVVCDWVSLRSIRTGMRITITHHPSRNHWRRMSRQAVPTVLASLTVTCLYRVTIWTLPCRRRMEWRRSKSIQRRNPTTCWASSSIRFFTLVILPATICAIRTIEIDTTIQATVHDRERALKGRRRPYQVNEFLFFVFVQFDFWIVVDWRQNCLVGKQGQQNLPKVTRQPVLVRLDAPNISSRISPAIWPRLCPWPTLSATATKMATG